jgi:hypothetical protein
LAKQVGSKFRLVRNAGFGGAAIKREDETSWHSFRHSWKTCVRHFVPREDVSDYLSGSANGSESRKYGTKGKHKGFPLLTLQQAIDLIPTDIAAWPLD